jgi:hypothetical protein
MTPVPAHPKIYHITHIRNLSEILRSGCIWSDARRVDLGLNCEIVGLSDIKRRRLLEIEVDCHPDTKVGQYTPFYFCPRSIMLYILHKGNHPDLNYHEGQQPIVHLQADLRETVHWAEANNRRWAFSDRNAGTFYANFYNNLEQLDQINWGAVQSTDFGNMIVKDGKQAEFLLWESFPWVLVERIGVYNAGVAQQVNQVLGNSGVAHRPVVDVKPVWYY